MSSSTSRIGNAVSQCECFGLQRYQTDPLLIESMECNIVSLLTIFYLHTVSLVFFLFHQTKGQHYLTELVLLSCLSIVFFSELRVIAVLKTFALPNLHTFRFQELPYAFNGDGVDNSFFYEVFLKFRETPCSKMKI